MARYWYLGGKPVERDALVRALMAASGKASEWQRKADSALRRFEKVKSPRAIDRAIKDGEAAERRLSEYRAKMRKLSEDLAKGDRRKRDREKPPPPPPGERWKYWVRSTYAERQHAQWVEFYFQRRDGARMTDAEVIDVMHAWVKGKTAQRSDIRWGRVRYGTRRGSKLLPNANEAGNFLGLALSGDVEVGEEQG